MSRPKRQRRRVAKTVSMAWVPVMAEVFDLPLRLGMTPPERIMVAVSPCGLRTTWQGSFTTSEGVPARSVVRLRHRADGSASSDGGSLNFSFLLRGQSEGADA
ncbi:MAG: hypothetical protein GC145_14515 [Caulobacter sp.]|nr:hypothetical protein [Caulobacter sp.]